MKKVKIFIVSIPIIIMVWWLGYRNNLQLEKNNVLVTLDCKLNDKIYSYEIVYDDESNLYKIKPNSSLLIEMQKSSEEELENIIKNIFCLLILDFIFKSSLFSLVLFDNIWI